MSLSFTSFTPKDPTFEENEQFSQKSSPIISLGCFPQMSPKKWSKSTFGWARAEVLGALVNSVFLIALCFSIFVESLKRWVIYRPQPPIISSLAAQTRLFLYLPCSQYPRGGGGFVRSLPGLTWRRPPAGVWRISPEGLGYGCLFCILTSD